MELLAVRAGWSNKNPLVKLNSFYSWEDPGKSSDLPKATYEFLKAFLENLLHFKKTNTKPLETVKQCQVKSKHMQEKAVN